MKKLTLLCFSPLVFANLALAGGVNAPAYTHAAHHAHKAPRYFHGFSVTGALGGMSAEWEANEVFSAFVNAEKGSDSFSLYNAESNSYSLSENSFVGYIGVDYAYQFLSGFVLGIGVTAGFDNLNFLNEGETVALDGNMGVGGGAKNFFASTLEVELENDFAILFKPGFVVRDNTLIYALVGPRWGNIETKLESFYGVTESDCGFCEPWDLAKSGSDTESKYQIGFTAGVGIHQMVSNNVNIGLEYAYTHYGDFEPLTVPYHFQVFGEGQLFQSKNVIGAGGASDRVSDISLNTHTVVATLTYQF